MDETGVTQEEVNRKTEVVKCRQIHFLIQSSDLQTTLPSWLACLFAEAKNLLHKSLVCPLLVQSSIADDKVESSADGEDDGGREEQNKPESDKMEEGCGKLYKTLVISYWYECKWTNFP